MPIYEYECGNCGHRLEAFQKISDNALTRCPECEEEQLRKLVSAAAFHLKGSGWYATDFRDKPKTDDKADKSDKTKDTEDSKATDKKKEADSGKTENSKDAKKPETGKSTTPSG